MSVKRAYESLSFGQLHYRCAGNAEFPPLVLLHQTPSHSGMYEKLIAVLERDFYLLAPDTPGMGQSDKVGGTSIAALAEGLAEWLLTLELGPLNVFGHHTGASLAVQIASDHRELVGQLLLSGPPLLDDVLRAKLMGMENIPVESGGAHLQVMWNRIAAKDSAVDLELVQREVLSGLALGSSYRDTYRAVCEQPFAEQLAALTCPVLALAGTEDLFYSRLDDVVALLEHGTIAEITGATTYVCESSADELAVLISNYIGRTV